MAEIVQEEKGGKKKGKRRAKKHSTHIDMTPMVDLACLLLTFFMLTTAFSKPKVMEIVLPDKKQDKSKDKQEIPEWRTLNIILTANDKVLWFNGKVDPRKPLPTITETDFSKDGIRKVLLRRNKTLFTRVDSLNTGVTNGSINIPTDSVKAYIKRYKKEDNLGPIVLIKADENVNYGDFVRIIDEMAICNIARYSVTDLNSYEKKMLADYKAGKLGTAP